MQLSFSLSTSGTSVSNSNFFSLVCNAKNKTYCFGCFNVIILILLEKTVPAILSFHFQFPPLHFAVLDWTPALDKQSKNKL